jgi:GAF domain-containing protein
VVEDALAGVRTALTTGVHGALEALRAHEPRFTSVYLYEVRGDTLVLTAWAGQPTEHTHIPVDQGICGAAVREQRTLNVGDVRADPRYIACSLRTRSELVVPIWRDSRIIGEVDVDSDLAGLFEPAQVTLAERVAQLLAPRLPLPAHASQVAG